MDPKFDNKIDELHSLKYEYIEKIKQIELEIKKVEYAKYKECEIINNGHEWISERESGPYGEIFRYCKHCNCEC
tara:strand:- start:5 stop:226 length:222 start_codon:yes stop_codon:yes gene_type:complete